MKLKTVFPYVLLLLPFTALAAPGSQSGEIRFSGQIVDAGCAVERVGALVGSESRRVELEPGLAFDVDTHRNACSGQSLPISMRYEALKASSDKGIVTVTYL
jgi:hypothetical protein